MASFELQQHFYDDRWRDFQFANRLKLARCTAILEEITLTGLQEPRMLDLGCGTGWLTAILGQFGPVVGVDLSQKAIQSAQVKFPHVRYQQANLFEWRVPEPVFDIVVSQEVIEHVEDQSGYLRVVWESLRPNGYLVLTTPNKATMLAMSEEQRKSWSSQPIENWLTVGELTTRVASHFVVLHVRTIIPGIGQKGICRLFNSSRIGGIVKRAGMGMAFDRLRLRLGLGLHTVLLARRRS